jgi:hypothetical protein
MLDHDRPAVKCHTPWRRTPSRFRSPGPIRRAVGAVAHAADVQVNTLCSAVNAHYAMMSSRTHMGSPDVPHLPQQAEGADGNDALVPEASVSMPDDQEPDAGYQAHKDKPAYRKGRP